MSYLFFPLIFLFSLTSLAETIRPLGTATATRSNYRCNGNDKCYDLNVTCPGVATTIKATLSTRSPIGAEKGTISFHSGSTGVTLWSGASTYATNAISELNALGYRIVQVKWGSDWLTSSSTVREGLSALGCRPATVLNWINQNLNTAQKAFCVTGNSGGAVQLSYSLTDYGLDSQIKQAVLSSGPGVSRLDNGCFDESSSALYLINQTDVIDRTYGFKGKRGPCTQKDQNYLARLEADSITLGTGRRFLFPHTRIDMVLGEQDIATATVAQSQIFYDRLVSEGNSQITFEVLPGVDHSVHAWETGVNKIKSSLITGCF